MKGFGQKWVKWSQLWQNIKFQCGNQRVGLVDVVNTHKRRYHCEQCRQKRLSSTQSLRGSYLTRHCWPQADHLRKDVFLALANLSQLVVWLFEYKGCPKSPKRHDGSWAILFQEFIGQKRGQQDFTTGFAVCNRSSVAKWHPGKDVFLWLTAVQHQFEKF